MSDIAKWAVLVTAVVAMIAIVLTLPFAQFLDSTHLKDSIYNIALYCGSALYDVRAFINLFLFPQARVMLSGLMIYLFISWVFKLTVKITAWAFHWIFK